MIADAAHHRVVLTCEDGFRDGGIGTAISEAVREIAPVPVKVLGVPTKFIPHDKPDAILAQFGLDAVGIADAASSLLRSLD